MNSSTLMYSAVLFTVGTGILFSIRSLSSQLVYHPEIGDQLDFESCRSFKEAERVTFRGTRMHVRNAGPNRPVLIHYHGNAGSACDRAFWTNYLPHDTSTTTSDSGPWSYVFVEYSGFANDPSQVAPNEEGIRKNVRDVVEYIATNGFGTDIRVVGVSLGANPALYHGTLSPIPIRILLIAPFTSVPAMCNHITKLPIGGLCMQDIHDNLMLAKTLTERHVLWIVGSKTDGMIPLHMIEELNAAASTPHKKLYIVSGNHNDLVGMPVVTKIIRQFLTR